MEAAQLPLTVGRARRWFDHAALVAVGGAILLLVAMASGLTAGFRPLVVRSGSMEPAIHTGDVVLSRVTSPQEIEVGDVVTFRDPTRDDALITHRVIGMEREGGSFAFVTRGDANTGIERWNVAAGGTVGRVSLRIPRLGYVASWLGIPAVRLSVLLLAAALLTFDLLRRIWAR
ncbi:MAG TPA: signal peptidase I [Actinomycetota bacterium]|jgi:signal peptidase